MKLKRKPSENCKIIIFNLIEKKTEIKYIILFNFNL